MKPRVFTFTSVLCVGVAVLSFAPGAWAGKAGKIKPKPETIVFTAIASIDMKAMTITTQPRSTTATETKTFKLTSETKVIVNGHDGTLSDLHAGQQIRVSAGIDPDTAEELNASEPPAEPKDKQKGKQ